MKAHLTCIGRYSVVLVGMVHGRFARGICHHEDMTKSAWWSNVHDRDWKPHISRPNRQEIARKLVKKEVLGIIGHRSSGSSLAAVEIYNQHKIAMISPTSSSTDLDNEEYEVFFRTVASNKEYAEKFYL